MSLVGKDSVQSSGRTQFKWFIFRYSFLIQNWPLNMQRNLKSLKFYFCVSFGANLAKLIFYLTKMCSHRLGPILDHDVSKQKAGISIRFWFYFTVLHTGVSFVNVTCADDFFLFKHRIFLYVEIVYSVQLKNPAHLQWWARASVILLSTDTVLPQERLN